jgi:spore coat polysaccharide biosynthesis protein SpsF
MYQHTEEVRACMNVVAIIQARINSTRLPGKVLKEVLNKPLLTYQLERLLNSRQLTDIVVATTTHPADDQIVELCHQLHIPTFRGSEHDVLSRYHEAAIASQADIIVRLTSDCPVLDPAVVDQIVAQYLNAQGRYDYISNTMVRTYPRGMDTEVFSAAALHTAFEEAAHPDEREHVTPFLYHHPERYGLATSVYAKDESHHRWTVDTQEDFQLISRIIEALYPHNPDFTLEHILELLQQYPAWQEINRHVNQKSVQIH